MAAKFQVISFNQPTLTIREHKKRKFHAKTRGGCVSCKQKRVKCDETKPVCLRCSRNDRACLYDTTPLTSGRRPTRGSPDAGTGLDLRLEHACRALVAQPSILPESTLPVDCATKYGGTPAGVLLQFFNNHHMEMLSGAPLPTIWDMACTYPHLLTGILSASACYLRHHAPDPRPHRVAETYQQTLTIQSFQESLEKPLEQARSDALLLTAVYLNLLAFTSLEDENPFNSWVYSTDPGRLGWITVLLGIKPLLMVTEGFRKGTALTNLYEGSDDENKSFSQNTYSFTLPDHWSRFVELDRRQLRGKPSLPFLEEGLYLLFITRWIEALPENTFMYMQFFRIADPEFRELLLADDERTLWLMAYWFGLLGRYDLWWSRRRIRRDFAAILISLQSRGLAEREGEEGTLWEAMLGDLEALPHEWAPGMLQPQFLSYPSPFLPPSTLPSDPLQLSDK